ncbi:acyltransferase, partial [Rhodoblastus sp.]|uniref:acyltransferase family protein n=1 Tax=Rhodoblastus sp. TaxID=1962975 RepID=UPI002622694F
MMTASLSNDAFWTGVKKAITPFGNSGVDLFFVISGTIMYIVSARSNSSNSRAFYDFSLHRIARIYPLFLITFLVSVIVAGYGNYSVSFYQFLKDALLIDFPSVHPVSWTLPYEVRFYVVVSLMLLLFRKYLNVAFVGWGVVQFGLMIAAEIGSLKFDYFNYVLMTEFSFGLAVGYLIERRIEKYPIPLLFLGVTWLLISYFIVHDKLSLIDLYRHLLFGIPASFLVYSLVVLENRNKIVVSKNLVFIGGISYSIYLWHNVLLTYMGSLFNRGAHGVWFGVAFMLIFAAVTFVVSVFSYTYIEKPSMRFGRYLTMPSRLALLLKY